MSDELRERVASIQAAGIMFCDPAATVDWPGGVTDDVRTLAERMCDAILAEIGRTHAIVPLRASSREAFAAMAPTAPLPWNLIVDPNRYVVLVDAKSAPISRISNGRDHENAIAIAGMIVVAANTLGGYRASASPPQPPTRAGGEND
jgi:hypothetical protein